MKKWILHIMLVGVLGMLAASCSQDADSPLQTEGKKVQVTFTLATGGQDAYSRSTWEGYDGDGVNDVTPVYGGEVFDNKIDPDQLQVLICDDDCTPIAKVQRLLHTKEGNNVYKFTGSFEATIDDANDYKIMVFANCPEVTSRTDFTDNVVATMPSSTEDLGGIPMWGVQQISGAVLLAGNTNLKIYVLRALAKVEISISAEGYTLESASFNQFNKNINCIPNGFSSVSATTELSTGTSGENSIPASFKPNENGVFQDDEITSLSFITIEEDKKLVAYVPEYLNEGESLAMTISVMKDGTVTSHQLPFKYSDTAVRDVVRNYYYTYNIVAVNTSQPRPSFELKYQVMNWSTVTNPNLTFGNPYGDANGEDVPDGYPQDPSQGGNTPNESGNVTQ